jgi:DNA-binding NarL/FixJ family response regulator
MRIVIAEDSVLLRAGIERLLVDAGHSVVATVDNGDALVASVAEHVPDLCIVDVRMPPTFTDEGIRAAITIREEQPSVGVLVLSQYVEERYASDLLARDSKGIGYLLKDRVADVNDFLEAIDRVANGGAAIDAEVVKQLFARTRQRDPLAQLSPRECDVIRAMAEGRSNAAIADELSVGEGAVEKHVNAIFLKLGLAPDSSDNRRVLAVLRYLGA